jgi:hypothetical protein
LLSHAFYYRPYSLHASFHTNESLSHRIVKQCKFILKYGVHFLNALFAILPLGINVGSKPGMQVRKSLCLLSSNWVALDNTGWGGGGKFSKTVHNRH